MSFREHLADLQRVLVRVFGILLVGFVIGWEFRIEIFEFLSGPITKALADNGIYHYQAISIAESIVVYLKSVLVADFLVFSPLIFHQLWTFVGPGLLRKEKTFIIPVTFFSVVFFLIGVAFAYTVIVPFITDWLVQLTLEDGSTAMMVTMQNAYSVSFTFLLMFGLVFELPLVIYFLALFGVVNHTSLLKFFRYFVVLSLILGAMLTPPDPVSQLLMAVPLNVLYAFGILVAWGVGRARNRVEESRDASGMTDKKLTTESVRLLGGGLILMSVAVTLIFAFAQTLPAKKLTSLVPADAQFVVGYNPAVLNDNTALNRLMQRTLHTDDTAKVLTSAGVDFTNVREVLIADRGKLGRLAIFRGPGCGALRNDVATALKNAAAKDMQLNVGVLTVDENTFALGESETMDLLGHIIAGEREGYAPGELEKRLLGRIQASGPLWAWLPDPSRTGDSLLSAPVASSLKAAGAWLHTGDDPSVSFEFRASDAIRADTIEARLDTEKMNLRQGSQTAMGDGSNEAILLLIKEAKKRASPATRADLIDLQQELSQGPAPLKESSQVPLMSLLSRDVQHWAVRRNEHWITLTTELKTKDVEPFMKGAFGDDVEGH
jgi:sec-independent protein translocase protein TatC